MMVCVFFKQKCVNTFPFPLKVLLKQSECVGNMHFHLEFESIKNH